LENKPLYRISISNDSDLKGGSVIKDATKNLNKDFQKIEDNTFCFKLKKKWHKN